MWNPFKKHEEDHDDIAETILLLGFAVRDLQDAVKELREEVDYLTDFLDD
jgi:hypothetical protein